MPTEESGPAIAMSVGAHLSAPLPSVPPIARPRTEGTVGTMNCIDVDHRVAESLQGVDTIELGIIASSPHSVEEAAVRLPKLFPAESMESVTALVVKGPLDDEAACVFVATLIRCLPCLRKLDLSATTRLHATVMNAILSRRQLHELHLSLSGDDANETNRAIERLCLQTTCTVQHLELYHCSNTELNGRLLERCYSLPFINRLAFIDYAPQLKLGLSNGFAKALVYDPYEQVYSQRGAYTVRSSEAGLLYTLRAVRRAKLCSAPCGIGFSPVLVLALRLTADSFKVPDPRWIYQKHVSSLGDALIHLRGDLH